MIVSQTEPTDEYGHIIPQSDVALYDSLCEFPFDIEDEDYDAHEWPDWTDANTWCLGPEIETFEPSPDDLADYVDWSASLDRGRTDQDLEEAYRLSIWQDLVELERRITDADLEAAGLAVG